MAQARISKDRGAFEFSHPHPTLITPLQGGGYEARLFAEGFNRRRRCEPPRFTLVRQSSTIRRRLGVARHRFSVCFGNFVRPSLAKGPASLGLSLARPLGRANGPASMGTCTHGPKGIPLLDYLTQSSS